MTTLKALFFLVLVPGMLWVQYLLALAMMGSFSMPFLWAGFGPGEREFNQITTLGPVRVSERGDETTGRIIFGGVGLLCGLGTLWYAVSAPGRIIRGEFTSMFDQNKRTIVIRKSDE